MATSLPPVNLGLGEWVDIYAETGITVGTQLTIQNTGDSPAILTESSSKPISGYGFNRVRPNEFLTNSSGSIGAWALSGRGTTLQVEVS